MNNTEKSDIMIYYQRFRGRVGIMLKLDQLYYLTQVAKYNSIHKAAEQLYLTPAAISTAMKQMEKECGYEILERTYRGVKLTEKGKDVVKIAEQILALHDEIMGIGIEKEQLEKEKYNLVVNRSTLRLLSNKMVGPQAHVLDYFNLMELGNDIKDYSKYLSNGMIVLTLFQVEERKAIENDENVHIRYLYASKQYPVSSKNTKYIKENAKSISVKEFAKLPKIKIGVASDIIEKNIVLTTDDLLIYQEAIQNDYGVGMITKFAPDILAFDSSKLKIYEPFEKSEIYIAILINRDGDKAVVDLLEQLIKG